jgi:urease accessory protein
MIGAMTEIQTISTVEPFRRLAPPRLERARGAARIAVRRDGDRSRLEALYQKGSAKIGLPRVAPDAPLEAILINTAGGVTGGDHLRYEVAVAGGARATIATQAAERVYRRSSGVAEIESDLRVGTGGRLDWLPQETILFDRSALSRRLTAEVAATASLLAIEAIVLGRAAMGETVREAFATDAWRIRRGGRLVFADAMRLDGDAATIMAGGATGKGARAFATLVLVSPDAEARIAAARAALDGIEGEAGVSAWNGILVGRLIAPGGQALRAGLMKLVEALRGERMPRVWHC